MRMTALLTTAALALTALPAAAQTLDRLREGGELRLGFRTDAAPLSYIDADGEPAGYTPLVCAGVAQWLATELKLEALDATFIPVTAENRFEEVAAGNIDLLCGAATITFGRLETVDFSTPVYVDGTAVMLPKGTEVGYEALKGKSVGVRAGTTTEITLEASLEAEGVEAEIEVFADHMAGLAAMETGDIDAYFADQSILMELFFSSDVAESFEVSKQILTIEKQGLAMPLGDRDFRIAVDRALTALYARGAMEQIFAEAIPGATPGPALEAAFILAPTMP